MATSPEYLRLASNATRSVLETAFECLRDGVVVVNASHKHFPVVLANGAARLCLFGDMNSGRLLHCPLYSLLAPASASEIEPLVESLPEDGVPLSRMLAWRFAAGESPVLTELKGLMSGQGHHLIMMTFAVERPEARKYSVMNQLAIDVMMLDRNLSVTYASPAPTHDTPSQSSNYVGTSALLLTPTAALARGVFARVLSGGHYRDDALEFSMPDGRKRLFAVDLRPMLGPVGIEGIVVVSKEITERRNDRSPENGEPFLMALTENALDIITVAAPDGSMRYVSSGLKNALGYTIEERRAGHIFDLIHPEDESELSDKFRQVVSGDLGGFSMQYRCMHKDGSYRWLESVYVSALDNPLINGVVINSRDITERRLAERRLAQREEVFRLAADAVDGVIFEWDIPRGIVHRSRGVAEVLGMPPAEMPSTIESWHERIHPQDYPVVRRRIGRAFLNGRSWTTTYRIRDARGRYRSILERGLIQRNAAGEPLRAIGCCVDVSEIKRLTDLLAETQRAAKMGGWEYSYATRDLTWTEEMFRLYETSASDFAVSLESMLDQCLAESRQRFDEAFLRAETEGMLDLELEIMTLKGNRTWVRIVGHIEHLDGRPFRAYGSVQDIQAQKLSRVALENSTGWLKLSMNMARMNAWRWHKGEDRLEFAIVDGHEVNLPASNAGIDTLFNQVHPKDRAALRETIERAFAERTELQAEFRLKHTDGNYRSYLAIGRPMFDPAGAPAGMVGVSQDITARRESEARLRRSEELLRATTANAADVLMLVDTDLRIRFINRGLTGAPNIELIGCDISAVIPPTSVDSVVSRLRHVLRTGEGATFEFESGSPGDTKCYFENRAVLVRDDGIGTGLSISMRNITERKRLEQEILDVSTRERNSIGRDLHDGLGQELTGVALMLRGLASRIQRQLPDAVDYVNEIVGLVNQSIESARALARGLLPVRTDNGGLPYALRALAARSRDLYGLEVQFRSEIWPALTLNEENSSHLYRIAQEALTNAARHGQSTQVEIFLLVTKNMFLLRITDNGKGFGAEPKAGSGMGLKIMQYRANMIGAKFSIGPNEPRGVVIRVTGEQPVAVAQIESVHAI